MWCEAGASPYSMGPASQGTATPMMSPAPPGAGPQDSMGYTMNMNGGDYSSPMSASQVHSVVASFSGVRIITVNVLKFTKYLAYPVFILSYIFLVIRRVHVFF